MGKWALATLANDRFAETTLRVPMTRLGSELAHDVQRMADLVDGFVADEGCLPPNHPGPELARWRGWLKGK
jgi:hypothetical protein